MINLQNICDDSYTPHICAIFNFLIIDDLRGDKFGGSKHDLHGVRRVVTSVGKYKEETN